MNVILLALSIALVLRGWCYLDTVSPFPVRDRNDIILYVIAVGGAFLGARLFRSEYDYNVVQIMAAAFLGELFGAGREFLVNLTDLCRVSALTKNQRRSR